jgi:hypothetical protein
MSPPRGLFELQQSSFTCLVFSSGFLLVGNENGEVLVLKNGTLVAQLAATPLGDAALKEQDDPALYSISVAAVAAFGSGFVAVTQSGNVAIFASVRRSGCASAALVSSEFSSYFICYTLAHTYVSRHEIRHSFERWKLAALGKAIGNEHQN